MPLINNRELVTTSFVWDIRNFAYLGMLVGPQCSVRSPFFNIRNTNKAWRFLIHPNGKFNEDYISFKLYKTNISDQAEYNFTLSIGRPNASPVKSYKYIGRQFVSYDGIGEEYFLYKTSNNWILHGPVRFRCDIEINPQNHDLTHATSYPSADLNLADTTNLSLDLKELFKIPFHSDLTVNMSGNEMKIHKYMLYGRFSKMSEVFQYRTVMEMPPSIEIEVSKEIFELLMHYIYTGRFRDSYVPIALFRFAVLLGLPQFIQCVHELAYSYHIYAEIDVEEKFIDWNLDELNFSEESSTYVSVLRTAQHAKQLAIQVNISDDLENKKFIDVSFKFLGCREDKPIILISKISLTSESSLEAFKEEKHIFLQDEEWHFPRLQCKKDSYNLDWRLKAELSMFDWSKWHDMKSIETKTKLYTKFQTVSDNLKSLQNSMGLLFQMAQSTSNLVLLSDDNKFFRVHDGIMWARWPGVKKLIDKHSPDEEVSDFVNHLELKLPSEVLNILLPYFYTGFIADFDFKKAEMLLKYNNELAYPSHLVSKCEALLSEKPSCSLF